MYPPVTDTGWVTDDVRRFVASSDDHVHVADPAEVAEVIAWLCTDAAAARDGQRDPSALTGETQPGFRRLDQEPARVRDERTLELDLRRAAHAQPFDVTLDREAGHDPDHEPQEVHDRADVVEDGAQPLVAEDPIDA